MPHSYKVRNPALDYCAIYHYFIEPLYSNQQIDNIFQPEVINTAATQLVTQWLYTA